MKPSKIISVIGKKALFLFPGFRALTWKGVVYCKDKSDIGLINYTDKITSDFKCHETIHVRQAQSTHDSWFCFYALYLFYWIRNFPLFVYGLMLPYYFIEFELEAYAHEIDYKYCDNGSVTEWKEYRKLSLGQRWKLAKQYKKSGLGFKRFTRQFIRPILF